MNTLRHFLLVTAALVSVSVSHADGEKTEPSGALTEEESKPYAKSFWKEYTRKEVHKQIRTTFSMPGQVEDETGEIAVTMSGPQFFKKPTSTVVEGFLTIGAVGCFVVTFEGDKVTKAEFMESLTGKGKRYETLQECHDVFGEMFPRLFPKRQSSTMDTNKAEQDGTGQPATRPESKSEGSDKPQPEAEGRSR